MEVGGALQPPAEPPLLPVPRIALLKAPPGTNPSSRTPSLQWAFACKEEKHPTEGWGVLLCTQVLG